MIDILILYEHKAREMETILLLKGELKRRGYVVSIFSIESLDRLKYITKMKPKLVITPFLYGNYELQRYVYNICGKVNKIINLQWEQVYNGKGIEDNKRTPKGIAKEAVHICWGINSYTRLKSNGITNAILVGAPHMDFLKQGFDGWYLKKKDIFLKYGLNLSRITLLFISSFSYLDLDDEQLEAIKEKVDFDPYYFKMLTIESRNCILNWFEQLLKENNNINIIYRPHPGEPSDNKIMYLEKKYNSFKFIQDYSVKQWIKISDVILNWYSTAGVEVYFAKKDCLFLRPINIPLQQEYEMFTDIYKVDNYMEFSMAIQNPDLIKNYYIKHPLKNRIEKYYINDKEYTYIKICNFIDNMIINKEYDIRTNSINNWEVFFSQFKSFFLLSIYKIWRKHPITMQKIVNNNKKLIKFLTYHKSKENDMISKEEEIIMEEKIKMFLKNK